MSSAEAHGIEDPGAGDAVARDMTEADGAPPRWRSQIDALFDRIEPEPWIGIATNTPGEQGSWREKSFLLSDSAGIAAFVGGELRQGFVRMTPLERDLGTRGGGADASCIGALWLDIDCSFGAHKNTAALPPTIEAALAPIECFPPASYIVATGGGLQAVWLLRDPLEREEGLALLNRWGAYWIDRYAQYGWHLDNVFDAARVLRIVGTRNHKPGMNGAPVEYWTPPSFCTYDARELADLLTDIEPADASTPWQPPRPDSTDPFDVLELSGARGRALVADKAVTLRWTIVDQDDDKVDLLRPDGTSEQSVTLGGRGRSDARAWSDAIPELDGNRSYHLGKFLAHIAFDRDVGAAKRWLAEQGFGTVPAYLRLAPICGTTVGDTAHLGAGAEHAEETRPLCDILDDVHATLRRFVVFQDQHAAYAITLWIAATHAQTVLQHATRLVIKSPEKRCGKSRLLDLIELTCHRPLMSVNATVAAIFRSIDADDPPTLILDEADSIFGRKTADNTEELRGLLNAGFQQNRGTLRCVGPKQTPTNFPTFAMAALAAIGDVIPDTITDRAINITLRRRAPHEPVDSYRHRRDAGPLRDLGRELHTAVHAELDDLERLEPDMPLEDRAADTWEPIVATADIAGREWPARARAAAIAFAADADATASELSHETRLLVDIRAIFTECAVSEASSDDLVRRLHRLPESPWEQFDLTASKLAWRLRPYGIRPRQIRPDGPNGKQVRGYRLEDLQDAFTRYLPAAAAEPTPSPIVTASPPPLEPGAHSEYVTPALVTEPEPVTPDSTECDGVTPGDNSRAGSPDGWEGTEQAPASAEQPRRADLGLGEDGRER